LTGATGANLNVASASGLYTYVVTAVRTLSTVCYNANTHSSYLQLRYDCDVSRYVVVLGVFIKVSTGPQSGTSNYNASYIPAY